MFATFYSESIDSEILDIACNYGNTLYASISKEYSSSADLKVEVVEKNKVEKMLRKGVSQYSNSEVKIEFKSIPLNKVKFFSSKLYFSKLDQVNTTLDIYKFAGANPFETIALVSDMGSVIITPPLVEEKDGVHYVINGAHRVFSYIQKNEKEIYCIVVSNVKVDLPGNSVPSRKLTLHKKAQSSRVKNLDYSKFRHVEAAMHPDDFKKSFDQMLSG